MFGGLHSCFAFFCLFVFLFLHGKNNAILARQTLKWHIVSLPVAFPASGDPSSPLASRRLCKMGKGQEKLNKERGFYAFALGQFVCLFVVC